MSETTDFKLETLHLEAIPAAAVADLQGEIDKIKLLTEEEFEGEQKKLLRKVSLTQLLHFLPVRSG